MALHPISEGAVMDDPAAEGAEIGPSLSDFAERFFVGVGAGAFVVSVLDFQSSWAASVAFAGFVMFLVCRWVRLVRMPSDAPNALDTDRPHRGQG
jgi:membrane protein implicated in regulation of membrane protease activity